MSRGEAGRGYVLARRNGPIATLLLAITFLPGTVAARTPSDAPPLPEWIEPFPTNWSSMASPGLELDHLRSEQRRATFSAQASISANRVVNDVSLGVPVAASIELARGKRTGYVLDSGGRVVGKVTVKLAAPEADSAIRHYQQGSIHYYLLDWGPLAGTWVKLDSSTRLLATRAWTIALLVFRNTNLDYTDAIGLVHHLEATMSPARRALMVDAALTLPELGYGWSSSLVAPQLTVIDIDEPLSELTDLGGGAYWLGPWNLGADLELHVTPYAYDSVVAVWQPWDEDDQVPSWGWGLSIGAGPWANGSAWSTLTVPPAGAEWWITDQSYRGEPYAHEWLHGVIDYYTTKGATIPDLHGNDLYGYVAENGSWRRWYADLLREHLVNPATGAYAGIDYRTWEIGTPSTNP